MGQGERKGEFSYANVCVYGVRADFLFVQFSGGAAFYSVSPFVYFLSRTI
jgi:hypothetical protein